MPPTVFSKMMRIKSRLKKTDNNTKNINYETLSAVFVSENKALVEMAGKLLLAAQRQKGLRQQICETMDGGTQENFDYMFKIIYDNDLIRFSSVKRALGVWTGLVGENYNNPETVGKKELKIISRVFPHCMGGGVFKRYYRRDFYCVKAAVD